MIIAILVAGLSYLSTQMYKNMYIISHKFYLIINIFVFSFNSHIFPLSLPVLIPSSPPCLLPLWNPSNKTGEFLTHLSSYLCHYNKHMHIYRGFICSMCFSGICSMLPGIHWLTFYHRCAIFFGMKSRYLTHH